MEIAYSKAASPSVHLQPGGAFAVVVRLFVLLAWGAGGEDGGPFEEVIVEGFFSLGVEVVVVGGLREDGYIFGAPQLL